MIDIDDPLISYREYPGPVLLLAGPGTGKTWQLAMRVKFLIKDRHASPDEIAIITFTNEAARNMRERLARDDIGITPEETPATISTMHSLGNTILGSRHEMFGLPMDYQVLNEPVPRRVLLEDAATIAGVGRDSWHLADRCRRMGVCQPDNENDACRICGEYKTLLRKCARVDYDDQILLACEVLKHDDDLLAQWQAKTRYLLVDEYQDINEAQCELIQLLSASHRDGLFVVGDDDQSIYSFRGGSPKYIREFGESYGNEHRLGRLAMSWRCPEHILLGARKMLSVFNKESVPKPAPVFSDGIDGNKKIVFHDVPSDEYEAKIIAGIAADRIKSGSVAVIIPNGMYLPPIKKSLRRRRLDFAVKGEVDPKGIVRFAVLADWADDRDDGIMLRYVMDLVVQHHDSLTMKVDGTGTGIKAKRLAASEILAGLWHDVSEEKSLYAVLCDRAKSDQDDFLPELLSSLDSARSLLVDDGSKRQNLPQFLQECGLLIAPGGNPKGIVKAVREWREERLSGRGGSSYPAISIFNMPSSKGLEADVVLVVGVSKDLFPKQGADVPECSRLFYVAMTRAKKELHLFSARRRPASVTFRDASYKLVRSPFITAIPDEHIEIKPVYPKKRRLGNLTSHQGGLTNVIPRSLVTNPTPTPPSFPPTSLHGPENT